VPLVRPSVEAPLLGCSAAHTAVEVPLLGCSTAHTAVEVPLLGCSDAQRPLRPCLASHAAALQLGGWLPAQLQQRDGDKVALGNMPGPLPAAVCR